MKFNSIISRYLFKEFLPIFGITLIFFSFVFIMARVIDITNMVVNYSVDLVMVIKMLACFIPYFTVFIIPIAVMIAVFLTFARLSSDNEIIAFKSGGIALYGLLPPVVGFGLLTATLALIMALFISPYGRATAKALTLEIITANLDIGLKERTFNDRFDGVMLYVNRIDPADKTLSDVFIEDQRSPDTISTVVAKAGKLIHHTNSLASTLRLYSGSINRVDPDQRRVHSIEFDTYDLTLELPKKDIGRKKDRINAKALDFFQLRDHIDSRTDAERQHHRYRMAVMELHQRFALPLSCLALGILAVPLGIQTHAAKRSFGLGIALFFFLCYVLMMLAGHLLGKIDAVSPVAAMWTPTVIMGGIGIYLFLRTAKERPSLIGTMALRFERFRMK